MLEGGRRQVVGDIKLRSPAEHLLVDPRAGGRISERKRPPLLDDLLQEAPNPFRIGEVVVARVQRGERAAREGLNVIRQCHVLEPWASGNAVQKVLNLFRI